MHTTKLRAPIVVLLLVCLSAPAWSRAAETSLSGELATLLAVKNFGEGNVAAGQAWQKVAQAPADQLPVILQAMDSASPLAANWIRAAVDAIAERQLQRGGKLPADKLEAFVLATSHDARPRRVAFEWLTKIDATAPDRLIPHMLDDPGADFRREAIERLVATADDLLQAEKKTEALALYRRAFDKSRDIEQIKALADKLKSLGEQVDLTAHFGFLVKWKMIGPFDNTALAGFDAVYPPEKKIEPAAKYEGKTAPVTWQEHATTDEFGMVDVNAALGKANGVAAYACYEFDSPQERDIDIRLGSPNAHKLWLNGQLLSQSASYHTNEGIDQFIAKGRLKRGKNIILLKSLQNEQKETWAQDWKFQLRVCDAIGTPVPDADSDS